MHWNTPLQAEERYKHKCLKQKSKYARPPTLVLGRLSVDINWNKNRLQKYTTP